MRYYVYCPDANAFNGIGLTREDREVIGIRNVDKPLGHTWEPVNTHGFVSNPGVEGDFPSLSDFNLIPVMTARAWDVLSPMIGGFCEALPIVHPNGKPHYLIHVMRTIDALDEDRSELTRNAATGRVNRIYRYAFKPGLLAGKHLFKLPLKSGSDLIFDDEFRHVVEENHLQGLLFKELPLVKQ